MSDNIKLSIEDMNLYYGNFHALTKYQYAYCRKKRLPLLSDRVDVENPLF